MPETQGHDSLPGILSQIVATKLQEVDALRTSSAALERAAQATPPARKFREALARAGSVSVIAECKRRSPGAGEIRPGLDPASLARAYEEAGASALSVLTDAGYFGGSMADLHRAREATALPALRKDFTIDPLQVIEARAGGADAVLLIVRILDDAMLLKLHAQATALGMAVLVEVHDADELRRALRIDAGIIGINNRDLATFTTDLDTTVRLLGQISDDVVLVSESGIRSREDVERLGEAGVDAILVGEALLREDAPGVAAASLCGVPNRVRARV